MALEEWMVRRIHNDWQWPEYDRRKLCTSVDKEIYIGGTTFQLNDIDILVAVLTINPKRAEIITQFTLTASGVRDEHLPDLFQRVFTRLPSLRVLDMDSNDFTDRGARFIAQELSSIVSLRELHLIDCGGIRIPGQAAIRNAWQELKGTRLNSLLFM